MLTAKGYRVAFEVAGRIVKAPARYAILHDPEGKAWPRCSVLVALFQRGGGHVEDADAERYFGYPPREGSYFTPPHALSEWKRVGEVSRIDYWRPGEYEGKWFHPFKDGGWVFKAKLPVLYRRGRLLRLELHDGCVLSWRGFQWP